MKKWFSILLIIVLVLIGTSCFVYDYLYNTECILSLKENREVPLKEEVTNLSFVDKVENGKVITKKEKISTEKIGKIQVDIELKNKYGRPQKESYEITVVDTIPPVIEAKDKIEVTVGSKVDLLKDVKVTDNYDKDVKVTVEGEYDLNKVGQYKLNYYAVDQSKNEVKKEFSLTVKKQEIKKNNNNKKQENKKGVTYINGILIVNKTYSLPRNYGSGLTKETQQAFNTMKEAAKKEGVNLKIISGFRSYDTQSTIYNNYVAKDGKALADRYSARPGYSEHQTGLAIDINSLNQAFENTKEGKWLKGNGYKYGFILRYPKEKESVTGYMFEPWHYRYVGKDIAQKLYNNGTYTTLEEYLGIDSKYR